MKPALLSLLCLTSVFCPPTSAAEGSPNVLLFFVDALGYSDIGGYGSTLHETPHIDALAKSGLRFTDAYSAASICSPTLLSLAGLPDKKKQHVDGINFKPITASAKWKRPVRPLHWHYPHYHGSTWTPGAAIRDGNMKLIEFYDYGTVELYDLSNDLGETKDLSKSHPEQTKEPLDKLHAWQKQIGAKMPIER